MVAVAATLSASLLSSRDSAAQGGRRAPPAPAAAAPSGGAGPSPAPAAPAPAVVTSPAPTVVTSPAPTTSGGAAIPPAPFRTAPGDEPAPRSLAIPASEADQARNAPVRAIEVTGNRRVSKDEILGTYLRNKVSKPFSPDDLAKDVREMWASGFFDDIEVDLERSGDGVTLRIHVRERPTIKSLVFEGNAEIETEKITEAIEVKPGTILSYPALRRALQKIRDMNAEKGYFLAEAAFEVQPQKDNEVIIKFTIKEHEQVSVRRVSFLGNKSIPESELRAVMITGADSIFNFGSGGPFRQDAFDRDVYLISSLYLDRGYWSANVSAPRVQLTPDRSGIELTLIISEGPQYHVRSLRIFERDKDGNEVEPIGGRRHLREMIKAKPGDVFNRADIAKDIQDVRTMYRDAGYANVDADPKPDLDAEAHEADVLIPIQRGPLVRFNRIEIRGNTKTRDKVLRRELEIAEGELFSETKLERSKRRVLALGYFERVDVSTEQADDPTSINVNIEVAERPTGTFQVGAGFSSIESFIATAQVQQANLFGTGQSLSIQGQISGLRQLVNVRYFEPYLFDSDFSASIDLFDQLRIYNDFSQTSVGGSLTIGYPIIQPQLRAAMSYNLQRDKVSTESTSTFFGTASAVSVFQRLPLANLFNDGYTSSVRPTLTFDTRDNRLFPTSGVFLQASAELATSHLASQNQFLRYRTTGRFYYPIGAGIVLKLNTESGVVTSPKEDGVPIFARFFLGGILDVRGYRLRTLGPRLPLNAGLDPNSRPITNGANIGGNVMYYQNLELEFPIVDKVGIRGVIFTDAGNAWNLEDLYCTAAGGGQINGVSGAFGGKNYAVNDPCFTFPGSLAKLRTSYGAGIRWFSPLGPLRFEYGFPVKPLPYEEKSVFEFTIGNFF